MLPSSKRHLKIHKMDSHVGPFLLPPRIKGGEGSNHNSICKRYHKRKRHVSNKSQEELQRLQKCKLEVQEAQVEKWLEGTGRLTPQMWKIEQRRVLKTWFDLIDRDKSGEIDIDELADPLMSTGIAKTMSEVRDIVQKMDDDGSNSVDFKEFLAMMKKDETNDFSQQQQKYVNERKTRKRKALKTIENPIIQLTKRQQNHSLEFNSVLSHSRRKLLMDATMEQCRRREKAHEQIMAWRTELKDLKGVQKLRKGLDISVLIQKMETDRVEKENFVRVMEDMLMNDDATCDVKNENEGGSVKEMDMQHSFAYKSRNYLSMLSLGNDRSMMGNGGRCAVIYPRTRTPSIPKLLGIRRRTSNGEVIPKLMNKII
jgi:hypothetical protein